jgi:RNA polymerase sigma factor (sigma-70 family)
MAAEIQAIERVYAERYVRFRNALATITGSLESGADAVHEGFARAVAHRKQFRGDPKADGAIEAWIWRITVRAALEQRNGEPRIEDRVVPLDPRLIDESLDPDLAAAIRQLTPKRRLLVFLRYFADLPYSEIAAICGIAEGTVAAALAQTRAALRETLERAEETQGMPAQGKVDNAF